ncbi:hypothetical protein Q3G72_020508 [Acer saccharum]|nr:hypothetical protein Q3G72_020508 [Acer saccharum]
MYALAGSIILRIAFGQRFTGSVLDHDKFSELIHDAEALLGSLTADEMFPYVGWIIDKLTGYHTKLERVFHELDMFYEQAIGDHLKAERETNDEEDIIDVMLKIVRNQKTSEARFTEVHIKAILMDIFLAGVGTSAKTVVWAMAELARNPRAMNKAQDEVRNFFRKKGKVSEDDIDQLHYLKLIIKETLRLHPAIVREEEIASLLNSISQSSSSVTPVDLSEKIHALAGSIILRIAFGQRFPGSVLDNDKFSELIHDAEALFGSFTADEMFPYVGWIIDKLTGYHTKLERVFHELDMFYEQVIGDHLKAERETNDEEDIIDVMLKIVRNQKSGESWFTEVHIKAILTDIFLAGVDTSAKTVIWAMAELARNARVMNKAQDEVRNFIGKKGKVSENDIDQLHYLKLIIKETLRLHPAAPLLLPRETISHFKEEDINMEEAIGMSLTVSKKTALNLVPVKYL